MFSFIARIDYSLLECEAVQSALKTVILVITALRISNLVRYRQFNQQK